MHPRRVVDVIEHSKGVNPGANPSYPTRYQQAFFREHLSPELLGEGGRGGRLGDQTTTPLECSTTTTTTKRWMLGGSRTWPKPVFCFFNETDCNWTGVEPRISRECRDGSRLMFEPVPSRANLHWHAAEKMWVLPEGIAALSTLSSSYLHTGRHRRRKAFINQTSG